MFSTFCRSSLECLCFYCVTYTRGWLWNPISPGPTRTGSNTHEIVVLNKEHCLWRRLNSIHKNGNHLRFSCSAKGVVAAEPINVNKSKEWSLNIDSDRTALTELACGIEFFVLVCLTVVLFYERRQIFISGSFGKPSPMRRGATSESWSHESQLAIRLGCTDRRLIKAKGDGRTATKTATATAPTSVLALFPFPATLGGAFMRHIEIETQQILKPNVDIMFALFMIFKLGNNNNQQKNLQN